MIDWTASVSCLDQLQKSLILPNLLVPSAIFFLILLKLAVNTYDGKNGIKFFCFLLKRNTNEDIHI
jgi:hypothetical protein